MKDGLQDISFDRILMRIKDVTSILSNIVTILTVLGTALWMSFKFVESQTEQQKIISEFLVHSGK